MAFIYEDSACVSENVVRFVFRAVDADSVENGNKLQCGPMPNVMAALANIGGALCSTPQSLADAHY